MIINTVPNMDLSESVVRLGTREDASLLADLGTRTFRESSPNTLREDLDSYLKENFTREKLLACLSNRNLLA